MVNSYFKAVTLGQFAFDISYHFAHNVVSNPASIEDGILFIVTCSSFPGASFQCFYSMDVLMSSSLSFSKIASMALSEFNGFSDRYDSSRE